MSKKRVLVWLSGWVDSAITAYLLQQQGYEVAAGFMKNFAEPENPHCHTREDRNMAIKVAHFLWIKTFLIFDFREEYNKRIINYIYEWYQKGITPNPDVLCNNLIKFNIFLEEAEKLGFDYIAMGHYASIKKNDQEQHQLIRGIDSNKDQSFFLSWLNQYQLSKALLPLWNMTKPEVRELAKKINLPNAERKDSQGLCFIGKTPIREFLKKKLPLKKWDIVDTDGNKVGEHQGAYFFTIGQSRWLDINKKAYVTAIDVEKNQITISYEKHNHYLTKSTLIAHNVHRINETRPSFPLQVQAKIRYRQKETKKVTITPLKEEESISVQFHEEIRAIAPGQIIVFYDENKVLGNAVIKYSS